MIYMKAFTETVLRLGLTKLQVKGIEFDGAIELAKKEGIELGLFIFNEGITKELNEYMNGMEFKHLKDKYIKEGIEKIRKEIELQKENFKKYKFEDNINLYLIA